MRETLYVESAPTLVFKARRLVNTMRLLIDKMRLPFESKALFIDKMPTSVN